MPQWTCLVCDPPAAIPYAKRASSTAVWRGHCARAHPMRCSECAHRIAYQVGEPPGHPCPRCCANTTEAHPPTGAGGHPSSPREADPWSTERTR